MSWTTPRTWVAGEIVTAALLNTHVRDNESVLKTNINDDGSLKNYQLLRANAGTDSNASATTVDTVAISGLTVKDAIEVRLILQAVTQQVARVDLVTTTDSNGVMAELTNQSVINAGNYVIGTALIQNGQNANTEIGGIGMTYQTGSGSHFKAVSFTATTPWTGSWTLGLRHGGVTSGGTFRFRWAVYKVAGQ